MRTDCLSLNDESLITLSSLSLSLHFLSLTSFYNSAKAWRAWGLVNFEVVAKFETQSSRIDLLSMHLGPALDGFFRTVALAPQDSLQHLLRILTLWFKHGHLMEVEVRSLYPHLHSFCLVIMT